LVAELYAASAPQSMPDDDGAVLAQGVEQQRDVIAWSLVVKARR